MYMHLKIGGETIKKKNSEEGKNRGTGRKIKCVR